MTTTKRTIKSDIALAIAHVFAPEACKALDTIIAIHNETTTNIDDFCKKIDKLEKLANIVKAEQKKLSPSVVNIVNIAYFCYTITFED